MTEGRERLRAYRAKRRGGATPEPGVEAADAPGPEREARSGGRSAPRFVVQQHHARRLHWDLRLERDGVLKSWALPRGIPLDPGRNRLAVHTEDHPLEYLEFEGEIPAGEYGAGTMTVWDSGTYEAEKFTAEKVVATFHGERLRGRYALFRTRGEDWMIHRMDPPERPREPLPTKLEPMKATLARLPPDDEGWAYEIKWDGVRALAFCEPGHLRLVTRTGRDVTRRYPEVRGILGQLGAREALLDGELVAFDERGRPSFQLLQRRMHVESEAVVRRLRESIPVTYVIFDLLHLDGRSLLELPYEERRRELEALGLDGERWQVPRYHRGNGAALLAASRERGLEGIIAKRLDSPYRPGKRGRDWLKIKNVRGQEVVIGGWVPGQGQRRGRIGALVVGYYERDGEERRLRYAGKVGTGFSEEELGMLAARLGPLRRRTSPFEGRQPPKEAIFVEPELVCEVEFSEWTRAGTLRQPSYKGLRDDKPARDVVREEEQEV
jgi:bifunctional non-homologous end joining protein LigD